MSENISPEEVESKLSLVVLKPQEGKTFICISDITGDKTKNIHIVLTMNTLSAGMQFFGRMEESVGSKNIVVFNSKKKTAGKCLHAKNIAEIQMFINKQPDIKVIVCCAHEKRIRNSIPGLIEWAEDSKSFMQSGRKFNLHIDEAHKYIPENKGYIERFNASLVVKSITGYSASPDGIWDRNKSDSLFHKILIRDVESELSIVRSTDYFGVKDCEFFIVEEDISADKIVEESNVCDTISRKVCTLGEITSENQWYHDNFYFNLGNEYLLLSYLEYIIPKMEIKHNEFSYHFVPAYTRRVTHYACVDILLKHYPTANVIVYNAKGTILYRYNEKRGIFVESKNLEDLNTFASEEEKKKLLEPSYQIQQLIKDTPNRPTFVSGFECVGMSVTLINEALGNFDSIIMAHQHYSRDKLYQLCRFLFNYTNWTPESRAKIKRTKFYSLTKSVVDICRGYEKHLEHISTEFAGKTVSLREIQGLEPEEPSEREVKNAALTSIKLTNSGWRKFKVYDGNDKEIWLKVCQFYEDITNKELKGKSDPREKEDNGFYKCSTTGNIGIQTTTHIESLKNQSWSVIMALQPNQYSYARVFVGYENLDDNKEYTIYVKYAKLEENEENKKILEIICK